MEPLNNTHYDAIIIGAGMSGIAAGIRLALFDKKVLILERHNAPGGLNSFYSIAGRKYDVGLHALTNFVGPELKQAPLNKIFRQLRISREAFDLSPQKGSRIIFPSTSLRFSNDFRLLESEIAQVFPHQIDAFRQLTAFIGSFNDVALDSMYQSTREFIKSYLSDPLLIDMILLPLMYYGSAQESDMDLSQFVTLFKSIYFEGFARPYEGVRLILRVLLDKYRTLGGERRMRCGVRSLKSRDKKICEVHLDDGSILTANHILSSIGWLETLDLCKDADVCTQDIQPGNLSFVETITYLKSPTALDGCSDTILFFNNQETFSYKNPSEAVSSQSGVICLPGNYLYQQEQHLPEACFRVTALANYQLWKQYSKDTYLKEKAFWSERLQEQALNYMHIEHTRIHSQIVAQDMFTPTTIERYTGHKRGAIYGSTTKNRLGKTHLENLYICGTDQGFLGIVGALLSGISMANLHILGAH